MGKEDEDAKKRAAAAAAAQQQSPRLARSHPESITSQRIRNTAAASQQQFLKSVEPRSPVANLKEIGQPTGQGYRARQDQQQQQDQEKQANRLVTSMISPDPVAGTDSNPFKQAFINQGGVTNPVAGTDSNPFKQAFIAQGGVMNPVAGTDDDKAALLKGVRPAEDIGVEKDGGLTGSDSFFKKHPFEGGKSMIDGRMMINPPVDGVANPMAGKGDEGWGNESPKWNPLNEALNWAEAPAATTEAPEAPATPAPAASKEEAAQRVMYENNYGTGLGQLDAMKDPKYELGSGSALSEKARPIGQESGKYRRAARRLKRQGHGAAAAQMALEGERVRSSEPSIDTEELRGQRVGMKMLAGREAQKQDKEIAALDASDADFEEKKKKAEQEEAAKNEAAVAKITSRGINAAGAGSRNSASRVA